MGMDRRERVVALQIPDGQSITTEFVEIAAYTMFVVYVPTGTEGAYLQFLEDASGSPKAVRDEDGLLIMPLNADEWVVPKTACAALHRMYLRTCSDAGGTPQTQTGAVTLTVRCKA